MDYVLVFQQWFKVMCVDFLWIIVKFFSAAWTLILTLPIHWRVSFGEQMMECYISTNLKKKQIHLHLG